MSDYSQEKPSSVGLWLMRCNESDYEPEYVAITSDINGELFSHSYHLGKLVLDHLHDGLTHIAWKKVS